MSLDIYIPQPRPVIVGGKTINVLPLKMSQIQGFTRAILPALAPLGTGDIATAIAVGGDDLMRAAALAIGEPQAFVGYLYPHEFILLVEAIVEVNADFFARRALPALNSMLEKTATTLEAMPLPSFLPTGTAGPESSTTP